MVRGVTGGNDLQAMLDRPAAIAVGPGLGSSPWSEQLLQRVTDTELPLVVDADALNILAAGRVVESPQRSNWILTPHPGEAARLLRCSNAETQADRFAAVRNLQQRYGGVAILKGAGTLICAGDVVYLSSYGNPGMASGGMGDVLSGVLVSLLAQGLEPLHAACLGVCLHGAAADRAASVKGMRGLLATDLLPHLRRLLEI
jgi:NAD(P)H-hydrate epimerase